MFCTAKKMPRVVRGYSSGATAFARANLGIAATRLCVLAAEVRSTRALLLLKPLPGFNCWRYTKCGAGPYTGTCSRGRQNLDFAEQAFDQLIETFQHLKISGVQHPVAGPRLLHALRIGPGVPGSLMVRHVR